MASPNSMMPINEGTTTSNTNVIAVTSVTASRCSATVKKAMPIAPCTMIAQSSGLSSKDHEMPRPRQCRGRPEPPR